LLLFGGFYWFYCYYGCCWCYYYWRECISAYKINYYYLSYSLSSSSFYCFFKLSKSFSSIFFNSWSFISSCWISSTSPILYNCIFPWCYLVLILYLSSLSSSSSFDLSSFPPSSVSPIYARSLFSLIFVWVVYLSLFSRIWVCVVNLSVTASLVLLETLTWFLMVPFYVDFRVVAEISIGGNHKTRRF